MKPQCHVGKICIAINKPVYPRQYIRGIRGREKTRKIGGEEAVPSVSHHVMMICNLAEILL